MAYDPLNGPIPGENFTADTKNFAWHRPPEFSDLDEAFESLSARLMDEEYSFGIMTLMEEGMDIASLTEMYLLSAVGAGKITFDFALLLAGPIAHTLVLMAKSYDIPFDIGVPVPQYVTSTLLRSIRGVDDRAVEELDIDEGTPNLPASGFMNMRGAS